MDQSGRLTIKVKNQDGNCLHYIVRADTRMSKVMHAYCKKKTLHSNTVRFLYNGKRVAKNQTPASLQMKNGDEIDAMMHMSGGGGPGGSHTEHEHIIEGTSMSSQGYAGRRLMHFGLDKECKIILLLEQISCKI